MKNTEQYIEESLYKKFIELMPILTIDLFIKNKNQEYLLIKRKNNPLKNHFWTPGGRVLKGEMSTTSAVRKCLEETGLKTETSNWNLIGIMENNFYPSHFNLQFPTHTMSTVFECDTLFNFKDVVLDDQSSDFVSSSTLPTKFINHFTKIS